MGASENTGVEVMAVDVVMAVVAEEDAVEGAIVKTHINFPKGTEQSWQKIIYTLHTNGDSSPRNKIIIFKK